MKKKIIAAVILALLVILAAALPAILKANNNPIDTVTNTKGLVQVRVAGADGVIFDEMVDSKDCTSGLDLLYKAVGKENVVYKDGFISSVMGVDGIVYYTVKDGVYDAPTVSASEYPVSGISEMVFYNYNLAPMISKADIVDNKIQVTVTKAEFDANFAISGWVALAGATIEINGQTVITDAKGIAMLNPQKGVNKINVYDKDASGKYITVPTKMAVDYN